jgi:hypothetical protein
MGGDTLGVGQYYLIDIVALLPNSTGDRHAKEERR